MSIRQFPTAAMAGAYNYNCFLEETRRGREEISVDWIANEDAVYLLHISRNPFLTDAVLIIIGEREYNQQELEIIEHDRDKRVLYVRVAKSITDPFLRCRPQDIKIVSDLKFLIKRIHDWYAVNVDHLCFPCPFPKLCPEEMIQQTLSPRQKNAVWDVFTYAQSYVWGAPGTGKTRYVLAECLLQYYKAGKKVAVLAPTNNAIEQVLYGVLEKLHEHDISLDRVIRLGTPTSKFVDQYGGICEVQGIDKQLQALRDQIQFLQRILKHRQFLQRLQHTETLILPKFDQVLTLLENVRERNQALHAANAVCKAAERKEHSLYAEQLAAERLLSEQQRRMQSIGHRIGKALSFTIAQDGEQKLQMFQQNVEHARASYASSVQESVVAKRAVQERQASVLQADQSIDRSIRELKEHLRAIDKFAPIGQHLNRTTAKECRRKICEFVEAGRKTQLDGLERYATYEDQSDADLLDRISELEDKRIIIEAQSTQTRLEKAQIAAATMDTFLFRLHPRDMNDNTRFDHIFLDEAGYCSLIKGMALFGYRCPITMLGDHMQLPPVCEASAEDMQRISNRNIFLFAQSALYVEEAVECTDESALLTQYLQREPPVFKQLHRSSLCETYRFGDNLAQALEQHVYQNGFKSANDLPEFMIEVLDAQRVPGNKRRENPAEAEAIRDWLEYRGTDDYAILTPYRNQVKLLGDMLPQERQEQKIMTVHASQGREWDTVFLSVADTTDMYFTNSKRPELGGLQIINTAVSRAKHRLVIVCDKQFWMQQEEQLICELIRLAG